MEHQQDVKKELLQIGGKAVGIGALVGLCALLLIGILNNGILNNWTGGDTDLAWIIGFGALALIGLLGLSVITLLYGVLVLLAGLAYVDDSKRRK
ncbi:hypothetical protein [Ktedonobacter racemifer]|uniref:Uncharacterized protein n=1 Tax=Ktedonobacter racemifer DSM 44963 TaxID=485913 RepID=D6TIV7_KTERA|nr:hypothetical protein [Ktedonobacter racemifer]EFH89364.1 hypothetical protein Krac_10914 [Ktedonobacter racemifer DSM 44963]